jgi:hypothetical protein
MLPFRWKERGKRVLAFRRRQPASPALAIDTGESYLRARIRARELVSRAPVDSPNRWFDGCGEPFLALDAVMALGNRMTDEDRRSLADRLLRSQRMGAWAYAAEWGGIDVDTTSAAIRALDRLEHKVSLDGLNLFFNSATGLYNTFHDAEFVDPDLGLQLPPQTLKKHLGSHPCVLANVYLLLHERDRLPGLSHDLLRRLQKPDGNWFSYFYPSPFYSTRLFSELLTSLGEEYDRYMHSTLNALLTCASTPSSTQRAEILICLNHLQQRIGTDRQSITEKASSLVQQILATQSRDGSWQGEAIWEYFDQKTPLLVGFDHYRVRSTALCVRALKLWS